MKKTIATITAAGLIITLTLAALGTIDWIFFWVTAGIAAFIAYFVLPKI